MLVVSNFTFNFFLNHYVRSLLCRRTYRKPNNKGGS